MQDLTKISDGDLVFFNGAGSLGLSQEAKEAIAAEILRRLSLARMPDSRDSCPPMASESFAMKLRGLAHPGMQLPEIPSGWSPKDEACKGKDGAD